MMYTIILLAILCSIQNTYAQLSPQPDCLYNGEIKVVQMSDSNNPASTLPTDFLYIWKLCGKDRTLIDSIMVFSFLREFNFHIYDNVLVITDKTYHYSGVPDTVDFADIEKTITFNKSLLLDNKLVPAQIMSIDSKEYPLIRNCTLAFENGKAVISGDGGRINVNLDDLTATNEKGQPVIVHYPEKKR